MALIDNAVYVAGHRVDSPSTPSRATRGDLAWIGLLRPEPSELAAVAAEFDLHENAVEDARKGHQRAKLERYGDTLDRKSTRLNSSHSGESRMPSSA